MAGGLPIPVGDTSGYLNQGGSGLDVPGGGSGFDLGGGDPLSGLDQGPGGEIGQGLGAIAPFTGPAAPFVAAAAALAEIGQSIANAVSSSTGIPSSQLTKDIGDFFASSADWRMQAVQGYLSSMTARGRAYTSPAIPGANFSAFVSLVQDLFGALPQSGQILKIKVPGKTQPVTVGISKTGGDLQKNFYNAMGVRLPTNFESGNLWLVKFLLASGHLYPSRAKQLMQARGQAIAQVVDQFVTDGDYPSIPPFLANVWRVTTSDLTKAAGGKFATTKNLQDLCPCGTCDPLETISNWNFTDAYSDPIHEALKAIDDRAGNPQGDQPVAAGLSSQLAAVPNDTTNTNDNTASTGPITVNLDTSGLEAALIAAEGNQSGGLTTTDWILIGAGFLVLIMVIMK